MADRHGAQPHERGALLLDRAALDRLAAQRIRSIQHHHRHPRPRRGAERQRHRPDVGVVTAAHVLQIDDQHVQPFQVDRGGGQRLERISVEAGDGDAGARVAPIVDADHVLRFAAHAVLRPEQPRGPHTRRDQPIDDVNEVAGDARRMTEHAHPPTAQQIQAFGAQNVQTCRDAHTRIIRRRR